MSIRTQKLRDTIIYKSAVIREIEGKFIEERTFREGCKICLERARLITESYKETEGQPEVLRRGKALAKILENMTIFIRDGEQIVGNFASDPASVPVFPELAVRWVDDTIGKFSKAVLDDEGRREWRDIYSYWDGKSVDDRVMAILPASVKDYVDINSANFTTLYRNALMSGVVNFQKVLRIGLNGVISEIEARLDTLNADLDMHPSDYVAQKNFLEAALISCKALVRFANRYAAKAQGMTNCEPDKGRAKELEHIAGICQWVPANGARTLHEAMQSWWFIFIANRLIETRGQGNGARLDQLFYPFYKKDLDAGRINRSEAQELMEYLLIKLEECGHLQQWEVGVQGAGSTMYLNEVLGGTTRDGQDATNEFSFIILDAALAMRTVHTNLVIRYHPKINHDLILKAIDLVSTGIGYPTFFNDSAAIPMILERGIPLEDARDYGVRGCVSWLIPGKNSHNHYAQAGVLSLGKCLELALNEGRDMLTGEQLGYPTPNPSMFSSLEDIKNAYFDQVRFFVEKMVKIVNLSTEMFVQYMPLPFTSALVDGCIERGKDLNAWTYNSRQSIISAGNTNVADSLAAIKKFVYDEKRLTLEELIDALKINFEGKEELRHMLLNEAPKFGNDDDYVDNLNRELQHGIQHIAKQYKSWWGDPWGFDGSIAGGYYLWGKRAAASADGRKAADSFADAVLSPMAGRDRNGPTAVIKSMGKVTPTWPYLANQKFLPAFLKGENKEKFAAYLKTWADLGNYHIQFNVIGKETLLDAQAHPENYTNLTVRVAGYSAYFVDLSKGVQNDIIARTAQNF